jgi:hypothetical protein
VIFLSNTKYVFPFFLPTSDYIPFSQLHRAIHIATISWLTGECNWLTKGKRRRISMSKKMLSLLASASLLAFLGVAPGEVAARTASHGAAALPHHGISNHRHSAGHAPQHVAVLRARGGTELTNQQMDNITAGGFSFSKDLTSTSTNTVNFYGDSQIQDLFLKKAAIDVYSHVKGNSASLAFDNQAVGKNTSVQGSFSQETIAGQGSSQTGLFVSAANR